MKREINNELIDRLAKIVNLKVDQSEYEEIKRRLIQIEERFALFDNFNVDDLEPLSYTNKSFNTLRKDEVKETNRNEVLKNAANVIGEFVEIK